MVKNPDLPEGTVTVLFTDTVGSTALNQRLGDEAANALRRAIVALCREQLEKHRGVEVKGTGDGLMLAFQSARRAVRCAQDIQRAVAARNREQPGLEVQLRIGLHTGEVIHDEEDLFGETVVIASRLEQAAEPGGILASSALHAVLGTAREELVDRGEIALKGLDEPWRVYQVPWEKDRPPRDRHAPTPFVGRESERAQLRKGVARAAAGHGSLVLIGGEAGIGKTRLTEETIAEARRRGLLTLVGHCDDQEGATPYAPFVEMIDRATRIVPPEALRRALGDDAPEVARLIPRLRHRFADIPDPRALPPEQARRFLFDSLRDFIQRAAQVQPLLLVWEDLHWADESTLALLQHFAQTAAEMPLIMLGTYRDVELRTAHPLADALEDLRRRRLVTPLTLKRLPAEHVAAMLRGLSRQEPPTTLVDLLYAETDGLPFFIEEVYQHLAEEGRLFDAQGGWRPDVQLGEQEVPQSVALAIGRRLDRVSAACRSVLTAAAAAGRAFSYDLIRELRDESEDALLDALDEAEQAQLVASTAEGAQDRFQFVHELIRQTLLSDLSSPRRRRLHLRVAEAMERLHGADVDAHAADLAHHLVQAGAAAETAKTVRFLALAGDQALASYAHRDAVAQYQRALETLGHQGDDHDTQRGDLLLALGEAQRRGGRPTAAMETFQRLAEVARQLDDAERFAGAALGFEDAYLVSGLPRAEQDDPSVLLQQEALEVLAEDPSALRAMVLAALTRAVHFQGQQERGEELSREAVEMARLVGDKAALLYALHARRIAMWGPDDVEGRLKVATDLMRLAEEAGNGELALDGRQWRIYALFERGEMEALEQEIEAYDQSAKELRQPSLQIYPPMFRAALALLQGRYEDAEREMQEEARIGEQAESQIAVLCVASESFELYLELGGHPEAPEALQRLADEYPRIPFRAGLALAWARHGRKSEAREVLQRLVPEATVLPRDGNWLGTVIHLAATVFELGAAPWAHELYELLHPYAGRYTAEGPPSNASGSISRYLGGLAGLLERWDEAIRYFEEAGEMNRRIGARPHVAHTQYAYALTLTRRDAPGDRDHARQLLTEAVALYRDIGMPSALERAEQLLAKI